MNIYCKFNNCRYKLKLKHIITLLIISNIGTIEKHIKVLILSTIKFLKIV